ncbi:MAG: prepilin-type N-terminal cleavage/methylation domain-containing protein [Nitrosomonadales bacterium]|nr:prepilin-type N-terminal cleavage/methylation domain-containing protein [Nitrosomonadales bacterium]
MGSLTHRQEKPASPLSRRGFTLIELLVVLVVMSVALGMAVVQLMPDRRAVLRDEAQRLALLLENAGMEARTSGNPLAWSFETNSYRFWKKNRYGDWVSMEDDAMFRPRTLPDGMAIAEASVEAQPLKTGERMSLGAATYTPSFLLRLNSGPVAARIAGGSTGAVSVKLDGGN